MSNCIPTGQPCPKCKGSKKNFLCLRYKDGRGTSGTVPCDRCTGQSKDTPFNDSIMHTEACWNHDRRHCICISHHVPQPNADSLEAQIERAFDRLHVVGCPHCPDYDKGRINGYCQTKVKESIAAIEQLFNKYAREQVIAELEQLLEQTEHAYESWFVVSESVIEERIAKLKENNQ